MIRKISPQTSESNTHDNPSDGDFQARFEKPGVEKREAQILRDETDLIGGFKAIVAASPFRHRAIPIFWHLYIGAEIQRYEFS